MTTRSARTWRVVAPFALFFSFALIVGGAHAATVYVDPAAPGANNGTTWTDAYTDLQPALLAAMSGDEIWVVAGTYYPHASDRTVSFQLKNGVAIYGGFAGGETAVIQRSNVFGTILSGDIGTPAVDTDNSYHVVDGSGTDLTAILNGCRISGGYADGAAPDDVGGGIYCDAGSPTLWLIQLQDNYAVSGGAIYCGNASNPSLKSLSIYNNTGSVRAAGVFLDAGSSPEMEGVSMFINTTPGSGAGMYCRAASNPDMLRVTFSQNTASGSGGGLVCENSSPTLTNCVIERNTAGFYGGGVYLTDGAAPTLINVTVADNDATTQAGGGMFVQLLSNPVITNCIFWEDSAATGSPEIEILLAGGGTPVISHSIIAGGVPPLATDAGNNSSADPLFRTAGLPRISPGSPAIDAGNTAANSEPFDYHGRPRVVGADIDIGAYEFACALGPQVYVDTGALFGTREGTSWFNAFVDLKDAIAHADYCGGVTEIWVADGYYPTLFAGTDRTVSFELRDGVAIYGGFNGTETMRSQRNWQLNETVLWGEIGPLGPPDNAYHVVRASGVGPSAILDGFTIRNGNADGGSGDDLGGGIFLSNASPTLANLIVYANNASTKGGGMAAVSGSAPDVRDVTFSVNTALTGAGVYNEGLTTFTNVIFEYNQAGDAGGGVTNWIANQPAFTNCIFMSNSAVNGGGGIYNYNSFPSIVNASFAGNDGGVIGGGIVNIEASNPSLVNVIMWDDEASFDGNEIYNDAMLGTPSTSTVQNSIIEGSGGSGGGWNPAMGTDGGGNIDMDPRYRNWLAQDLTLWYDSPAIDAGDNGFNGEPFDIAGVPRITGPVIDIGAHEYPVAVGVGEAPVLTKTGIRATYPNPFNPTVSIDFALEASGPVELLVYDVSGSRVATLVARTLAVGPHTAQWNGRDDAGRSVASGVYVVKLVAPGGTSTRKVVMLK